MLFRTSLKTDFKQMLLCWSQAVHCNCFSDRNYQETFNQDEDHKNTFPLEGRNHVYKPLNLIWLPWNEREGHGMFLHRYVPSTDEPHHPYKFPWNATLKRNWKANRVRLGWITFPKSRAVLKTQQRFPASRIIGRVPTNSYWHAVQTLCCFVTLRYICQVY